MSRVIKFRVFFKEYGDPKKPHGTVFYDVMPATADFAEWLISFDADGTYDGDFKVGEDIELMQFTGLTDKNGKEIYEGDVLAVPNRGKTGSRPTVVEWQNQVWSHPGFGVFDKTRDSELNFYHFASKGEIIGNIYENPELIAKSA